MLSFAKGSPKDVFSPADLKTALHGALSSLGVRKRVVAVPPDITRMHSQAGLLTEMAWEYYQGALTDVMPSIGTHYPMSDREIASMFGRVPRGLFRVHDWREGCVSLGEVPGEFVRRVSGGAVGYGIPIQIDTLLARGKHDLILSIGQVVPHEVIGMANQSKNIFIGTGGREGINKTHFLGAAYGMERIMGRADTPVRAVLGYGREHFAGDLPILYVLTVVEKTMEGEIILRGLFIGDDDECFRRAAELSLKVNFEILDEPLRKVVVYLDPSEFKSTWLGNKAIYRTRMAIADGGELLVLAPGLASFGEDPSIDALIRRYGYVGTERVLELVRKNEDLKGSLGAAAHLIHGSSEGRFAVTYCPGKLPKEAIEAVGFRYGELAAALKRYDPERLREGSNRMADGEEIFYISNPALGLWAARERFA